MRQNIHVAGEFMMPELGISEIEMGWIYAAFIWGYALCQLPGGILGKRLGPRLALASIGLVWVITTALTGWLPGHIFTTGSGIIVSLLIVRFLVGVAHAPIYPIQAAVVERWFPVGHWALPNAVSSTGLTLGAAVAQPLVAVVMVYWGWRVSFYLFIPLGLVLFMLWWWYATDEPADHPSMTAVELAHIQKSRQQLTQDVGFGAWKQLIKNRDTVLLTCAYFAENYIFYLFFTWFFHYLVTELGFSILETGFLASLPWLSGAVMASLGVTPATPCVHAWGLVWGVASLRSSASWVQASFSMSVSMPPPPIRPSYCYRSVLPAHNLRRGRIGRRRRISPDPTPRRRVG